LANEVEKTMQNAPQGATTHAISLLLGHPDPTTLLTPEFTEAMQNVASSPQALTALQYGSEQGNRALLDYLIGKISAEQSIALRHDQMMIVAGSTHAVDMIARLYTQPGDTVLVESPTYADALHIFRDHGVELCGVPMDKQGVCVDEMASLLSRLQHDSRLPKLFYTIPTFHNPTGITLIESRRQQIVELARRYGFMIVEDDVYRHLAFEQEVPSSFFALAGNVPVMQIGSFSKTLAPGLRLGWLVAPSEAIARFVGCGTTQMGGGASPLSAQIVAEYCRVGAWDRHVESLRRLYQMRRDTMLDALQRYMPPSVKWTQPNGGFFLWLTLPEPMQASVVKQIALAHGVIVGAGGGYFSNAADGSHNLRLTYSFAPPDQIEKAVEILAGVLNDLS
jgi:2-aminoadipate transaminase